MIQDRAALLWVDQSRLHRSESVVRALRRRRSAGLPALRSRSGRRRDLRSRARDGAGRPRRARGAEDAVAREDDRLEGTARLRADRARARCRKQVWTFAKALAQELAARHPALITAEYRVAKRPRGRVLVDYNQNALGPDARVDLFGPAAARGDRLDAGDLEGSRRASRASRISRSMNVPARVAKLGELCGSRLLARAAVSISAAILSKLKHGG